MTPEEIESIAGGYHGDAFRILGPHAVRKRGGQADTKRVLRVHHVGCGGARR